MRNLVKRRFLLGLVMMLMVLGVLRMVRRPLQDYRTLPEIMSIVRLDKKSKERILSTLTESPKPEDEEVGLVVDREGARDIDSPSRRERVANTAQTLQELVDADDPCALVQSGVLDESNQSMYDAIGVLLARESPLPLRVNRVNNDDAGFESLIRGRFAAGRQPSLDRSTDSESLDFYNALFLGGLLYERSAFAGSRRKAVEILQDLSLRAKGNAAPGLFLAVLQNDEGVSKGEVRDALLKSFQQTHFDSYTSSLAQRMIERGLRNPTAFLAATAFIQGMPVPNYLPARRLVESFIREDDPEFSRGALTLGRLMMNEGMENHGLPEFIYWSALEYRIGQIIHERAWGALYGDQPIPAEYSRSYKEWLPNHEPLDLDALRNSSNGCNRQELDRMVSEERARFIQYRGQIKNQ